MNSDVLRADKESLPTFFFLAGACFLVFALSYASAHGDDYLEDPVQYHVEAPEAVRTGRTRTDLESSSGNLNDDYIHPFCPADGRSLGPGIPTCKTSNIDTAIGNASSAQIKWRQSSFRQRRQLLNTLLRYILDHQDEIVRACCLDSGKTQIDACFGEILVTVEKLQWTIRHGEEALKPSRRPTNLLMCYKRNTVQYEPLGVVAACVSWNYPFHNFISPIISAVFSGNAIVVKPSEQTAWSSLYFLDIIRGALSACGHDSGLVQSVPCWPDAADHLTSHPGLSHIIFIGSRPVAHKVAASAAKALTPLTLELGGKDPAIVLDDAATVRNLEQISDILMRGVFQSAGQNCIGIERVIALPGVYDQLIEIILKKIKLLRVGHPLYDDDNNNKSNGEEKDPPTTITTTPTIDMGSMISSTSFATLSTHIATATASGAILHTGGSPLQHPTHRQGSYFEPTLLSNVQASMSISQEEVFAPIFVLMRASDVTEAITIANSTKYNLGASVFGHGGDKASLDRCAREINAGMVSINDFGAYYAVSLPFGGGGGGGGSHPSPNPTLNNLDSKTTTTTTTSGSRSGSDSGSGSGHGRFNGPEGLRALCNLKSICEDAPLARFFGIRTTIPSTLRYPIADGDRAWSTCKAVVGLGYGMGIWDRISAVVVGGGLVISGWRGGGGGRTEEAEKKKKNEEE